MDYQAVVTELHHLAEPEYAAFSGGLTPGAGNMLGVRIPKLRALAKRLAKEDWQGFLEAAQDDTYEEIMLQGFVIGYAKAELSTLLPYVERFIPKIHNWAVNDCFCATFKIAAKKQEEIWEFLMRYQDAEEEFVLRVIAVMLMDYYLNDTYIDRVLALYEEFSIRSQTLPVSEESGTGQRGYYLKMGVAWGIATAYAKYPEKTMQLLKNGHLDTFTYRKSIQKMLESYRVSDEDKKVLRTMRDIAK